MSMKMFAPLDNPSIFIRPSEKLSKYIKSLDKENAPSGVKEFTSKKPSDCSRKPKDYKQVTSDDDYEFLKNLPETKSQIEENKNNTNKVHDSTKLINLEDLHWVYDRLVENNDKSEEKIYFHELFKDSEIVLPKNVEVDRNPELEKRCQMLKVQQDNQRYKAMTKNVDNIRRKHPEDTIAYQLKQINRHMIAIAQFIMSVVAGFAFGFIGIELLTGNLDFGFRLLLGIICSLVIALAELYFLAKKLNEELVIETKVEQNSKSKIN